MQASLSIEKHHYHILDGLRGVAAMMVILYHFGEGFATSPVDQWMNHGYLAVDFFFVLSGFVLGYAYDNRWRSNGGNITMGSFMLRRVIRLQPMVVVAVLLGVVSYLLQGSVQWDGTHMPFTSVLLCMLLSLLCLPCIPGSVAEIRGNNEMFPLNGPQWSLFFEYIGSICYALVLHRLSTRILGSLVVLLAMAVCYMLLGNVSEFYHLGFGWSLIDNGLLTGFIRMAFSFSAGLLISRMFKPRKIRGAFWICSLIIIVTLALPYVTFDGKPAVFNGLYDMVCTLFIFPSVVYMGACGITSDVFSTRLCSLLGAVSYPVYIIHYPAMYYFYAWVWKNDITEQQAIPVMICIFIGAFVAAYAFLRLYDIPVRKYLTKKLVK